MKRVLIALLFLLQSLTALPSNGQLVKKFPASGSLKFELRDDIKSPIYSWPRTLLSYPVSFSSAKIKPEQLRLTETATGKALPIQLSELKTTSDGTLVFARVNFFSALPPGADLVFELTTDSRIQSPVLDVLTEKRQGGLIEVDAGLLKLRLPVSAKYPSQADVPGPIIAINRGQGWIGQSKILSPGKPVQRIESTLLESGGLFRTYRITYHFAGGAIYSATVKAIQNYPFVLFSEELSGLSTTDHAVLDMDWTGFSPTKRYAANGWKCPKEGLGINEPVTTEGTVEEPHWFPNDRVEDPSNEMIFRLAAFQGNAPRDAVPAMSFWEQRADGQELGVFVPDTRRWNDGQYMIWQPTTALQVRFRYASQQLFWTWPLVSGTRETGIELSTVAQGEEATSSLLGAYRTAAQGNKRAFEENGAFSDESRSGRYAQWLRSWYGALNLDRVKDWVLTYPETARPAPAPLDSHQTAEEQKHEPQNVDAFEKQLFFSSLMDYPLGLDLGVMNISHRPVRPIVENYMRLQSHFTPAQRKRINALLLLSSYVNSGDDLAPVRTTLTGTPNMSADGFSVPAEIGVLFPDHPMGPEWRDQFEKTIQLQGLHYTRPDVPSLGSKGGRWTESLATYNWAYLTPTETAQIALTFTDGRNRLANRWMAQRGRWMVDELSAPIFNPNPYWRQGLDKRPQPTPWQPGMVLSPENGFERQYPAHGAHGSGTGVVIPQHVPILASYLRQYDPLTAEYLLWAFAQRTSTDQGEWVSSFWDRFAMRQVAGNSGTNPHLESSKYTGHGIILRAGVGTPEELSIHLDQVDQGPNYRWGNNGEGSSGVLYFFAAGQPWTGHERENTGDHANDDTTGITTFGIAKNGEYRSIGENLLDRPLYDLGVAQFGEISARKDLRPYSWPAYKSRSVMLVGTDYMILCDDAEGDTRFSWFTARDLPFPKIVFLNPLTTRPDHWTESYTRTSKGFMRDVLRSTGPNVVLVTHKKNDVEMENMTSAPISFLQADVKQYAWALPKGEAPIRGVYYVKTSSSRDRIFRDTKTIAYYKNDEAFLGKAGMIRTRADRSTEMAIISGSKISAAGLGLAVPEQDEVGISASFTNPERVSGRYFAPKASTLILQFKNAKIPESAVFYIDGTKQNAGFAKGSLTVTLSPGQHDWEITSGLPVPQAPTVLRTENMSGGASVFFSQVAGADRYRLEVSQDGGHTCANAAQGSHSPLKIQGLPNGKKVHVRVIAANAERESAPGREYPLYVTGQKPLPPDGLDLVLSSRQIDLSWGEVLGVTKYRLYRRQKGENGWKLIYEGLDRAYRDANLAGVIPPTALPGREDNVLFDFSTVTIYDYAVASVNGNGEGAKSFVADSDPTGWRNWWPAGQPRQFKRQTGFWLPPYVSEDTVPPAHYPQ